MHRAHLPLYTLPHHFCTAGTLALLHPSESLLPLYLRDTCYSTDTITMGLAPHNQHQKNIPNPT